jgi:hypothetical protein
MAYGNGIVRTSRLSREAQELVLDLRAAPGAQVPANPDVVNASELQPALSHLSSFLPHDQALLLGLAKAVSPAGETPTTWENFSALPGGVHMRRAFALGPDLLVQNYGTDESGWGGERLTRYLSSQHRWVDVKLPEEIGRYSRIDVAPVGAQFAINSGLAAHTRPCLVFFDPVSGGFSGVLPGVPGEKVALAGAGGRLYAFGGSTFRDTLDQAKVFEVATSSWKDLKKPLPIPRTGASAITVGDRIYVIGGDPQPKRVDVYNVATGEWETPFDLPHGRRFSPSLWLEDGRIGIAGGHDEKGNLVPDVDLLDVRDPEHRKLGFGPTLNVEPNTSVVAVTRTAEGLNVLGTIAAKAPSNPSGREYDYSVYSKRLDAPPAEQVDVFASSVQAPPPPVSPATPTPTVINNNYYGATINNNITIESAIIDTLFRVEKHVIVGPSSSKPASEVTAVPRLNVTVRPLPFDDAGNGQAGFAESSAGQGGFFLRTEASGQNLIQVATEKGGKRVMLGRAVDGLGPLPANADDLFLYHPATGSLVEMRTNANGEFATPLPEELHGEVYVFQRRATGDSPAGRIDLP